jgi:snRNA-activating protein complex subunit 3
MEQVRLADLDLAVANRPTYLYCHQGCCEHGWFVTDIRLRHPLDPPPAPGNYPRVLFRAPPPPAWRCGVCGKARAVAVAPHHPAAPEAPCLLCAGCRGLLLPPGAQARAAGAAGGGAGRGEVYSLL